MKTTTQKRSQKIKGATVAPSNPFDLRGMADKSMIATELGCIAGSDALHVMADYEPDYVANINPYTQEYEEGSEGHIFRVELHGDETGDIWLDDRIGDLRLQLAIHLRIRAKAMIDLAKDYERDAKK